MSTVIEKIAEQKIKQAMDRGDFDNLPGLGKPINLSDYFKSPAHLRVAYHILKNYGIDPPEVELHKQLSELKGKLNASRLESERISLRKHINNKMLQLALLRERNTK